MRTVGIERERFIVDAAGEIAPVIGVLLPRVWEVAASQGMSNNLFTYELCAAQIEDRTPPCASDAFLRTALKRNDAVLEEAAASCTLSFECVEYVSPERILPALIVNPFDARHAQLWEEMTAARRLAASSVAAVHVHLSTTPEEVVRVLNRCRAEVIDALVALGDHSNSQRVTAYRAMVGDLCVSPLFGDFAQVLDYIAARGGEKNVWDFVRYKPTTRTVEFRMFGATPDVEEVLSYVAACRALFDR